MALRVYSYVYAKKTYFIFWDADKNNLGVTDGGTTVFEGNFNRSQRSDILKVDLTEAGWNQLMGERAFRVTSVNEEEMILSRGIKEFTLKKTQDQGKSLKRIFGLLVAIAEEAQKKSDAPPPPAKKARVNASPRKVKEFAIKLKRKPDSDDEFIP